MLELEDAEILRSVLDGVDLGMYVVDRQCRICFWNAGAERITGYSRAEVLGRRSTEDVLHHCALGSSDTNEKSILRATIEDGEIRRETANLQHRDGHRISANIKTAAVRNCSGQIIGGVESLGGVEHSQQVVGPRDTRRVTTITAEGVKMQEQISLYLKTICERAQQDGLHFGVLIVHVDQLATLRKTHGREAATKLRDLVVATLDSALCTRDEVGIWSDSEFLVITSNQSDRGLELDAGRLRSLLQSMTFRWWGDVLPISVAIGGVMVGQQDTPDDLLAHASEALRQSMLQDENHITILDRWKDGN